MRPIRFFLNNPYQIFARAIERVKIIVPDRLYLKVAFRSRMGYKLNLSDPRAYSEKLQWLKLYDRRPEYTVMVDKVKAKEYVASVIGEAYIIPTLGVWKTPEEIDFDKLPERFVLKCNHNSGLGMFICKDKSRMDVGKIRKELKAGLKEDHYIHAREWPYKNVPRRILAEQFVEPEKGKDDLPDYKFFCFNGKVRLMFIATDRSKGDHAVRFDFFDENFNHLPFTNGHPNADITPKKPKSFELMKELAERLSNGIPQVRVDFYEVAGKVLFGEMTFFHWSGFMPYEPEEWDYKLGEMVKLPSKTK